MRCWKLLASAKTSPKRRRMRAAIFVSRTGHCANSVQRGHLGAFSDQIFPERACATMPTGRRTKPPLTRHVCGTVLKRRTISGSTSWAREEHGQKQFNPNKEARRKFTTAHRAIHKATQPGKWHDLVATRAEDTEITSKARRLAGAAPTVSLRPVIRPRTAPLRNDDSRPAGWVGSPPWSAESQFWIKSSISGDLRARTGIPLTPR